MQTLHEGQDGGCSQIQAAEGVFGVTGNRTDGHDLRCERSHTDPSRCTCRVCGGRRHGIAAVRDRLGFDEPPPEETETP